MYIIDLHSLFPGPIGPGLIEAPSDSLLFRRQTEISRPNWAGPH